MQKAMVRMEAPSSQISVLVVDDHVLLAETVKAVLSAHEEMSVEAVSDLDTALALIADEGQFDVVLLDYSLPGVEGLTGLRQLISANGGGVAIFSGLASWPVVERAIALGAKGFIPKSAPLRTLENAIRLIAGGDTYLPYEYLRQVSREEQPQTALKPREKKVLAFLCEGMRNKEIARELDLSEVIVKMDVKSICRKLGVRNRTEAAIAARREGMC